MKQSAKISGRKAWLCAMVTSALLVGGTSVSFAEETEPVPEFTFEQMVVTASRVPVELSKAGANVTVVTKEQIEKQHYQDLKQLLGDVNGVSITGQGHPGAQSFVRLNGDDRVVIMIDGRRVNLDKGAASGRAGYNLSNFPSLAMIERVEVLKGAASSLYGSDAVGGVINIITRKGQVSETTLDMGVGSWERRDYQLTHQGSEQSWNWFFTAGKERQGHFAYKDFKTGKTRNMPNSDYDKQSFTLRLDKEFDDDRSLTLNIEHATDEGGQPNMAPGFTSWSGSQHHQFDSRTSITNNWALTFDFNKSKQNPGFIRAYENYYASDFDRVNTGTFESYYNKTQGADWQNTWQLNDNHQLVGGVEWRQTKVESSAQYSQHILRNQALYLEDRIRLDDKWTFTPGIRYDRHKMFGSKTTPRAVVNYSMDSNTDIYVSWSRVFNAPNADDLFWPDDGYTAGNPNLKAETGYVTTIGINKKLSDKTKVTASYFHSQLKDAINWAPDANNKWIPSNVDEQRRDGAEIEIRMALSSKWSVAGAYSYLKSENKGAQDRHYIRDIKNNQPNGYRLSADYNDGTVGVSILGRGASGRSLDTFTSTDYWVWDAIINYKVDDRTSTYFKVNNITNEAYEMTASLASEGGPGGHPMAGRYYQFGIQYRF